MRRFILWASLVFVPMLAPTWATAQDIEQELITVWSSEVLAVSVASPGWPISDNRVATNTVIVLIEPIPHKSGFTYNAAVITTGVQCGPHKIGLAQTEAGYFLHGELVHEAENAEVTYDPPVSAAEIAVWQHFCQAPTVTIP